MTKRILAISSGGGHWIQLMRLMPVFEGFDVAFASVQADSAEDVPGHRFYPFRDVSRLHKKNVVVLPFQLIRILLKERPEIIVSTGSLPALFAMVIAKAMLRSKTIWIDSIANCERMSSSGNTARHIADVWLTQWEHLAAVGGPGYMGAVL